MKRDHRKVVAWQKAMILSSRVYAVTRGLPSNELYGLTSQMRRAAISVPSNIAEGAARRSRAEYLQFLYVARASLAELATQAEIAREIGLLHSSLLLEEDISEVGRIIDALITRLQLSL
jgi:four helix bundle protein